MRAPLIYLTVGYGALVLAVALWLSLEVATFQAPPDLPMVGSIRPGWSAPIWLSFFVGSILLALLATPIFPPTAVMVYLIAAYFLPRYGATWDLIHRVHLLESIVLLAVLGTALRHLVYRGARRWSWRELWPRDRLVQLMLAFALWSMVSLLIANASAGDWQAEQAHHPLRLAEALVLFWIAKEYVGHLTASIFTSLTLAAIVCLRALVFPERIHLDGDLALLAAMGIALAGLSIFATWKWWQQGLLFAFCGGLVKVLLETENRGGAVAFIAAIAAAWLLSKRRGRTLLLVAPLLLIGGLWFAQTEYWTRFEDYLTGREGTNLKTAESRIQIWQSALKIAAEHPIVGVGWGNTYRWSGTYGAGERGITTHNNFLGVLIETGAIGLALYVCFWGVILWSLWRRIRAGDDFASRQGRAVLVALIAYFAGGMFLTRHDMVFAFILAGWGVGLRMLPLALPFQPFGWLIRSREPANTWSMHAETGRRGPTSTAASNSLWARGQLFALAILATGLAIYGSLVPLEYQPLSWEETIHRFRNIRYLELGIQSRSDLVANFLLFIPLGVFWTGALLLDRRRGPAHYLIALLVPASLALLACTIEMTQLWFPRRTVSLNDILAESSGGAVGTITWLLFGQRLAVWIRSNFKQRSGRSVMALQLYAAGYTVYSLLPFDVTIRPQEIYEKYKLGRFVLVPFSALHASWLQNAYDLFLDVLLLVPIGAFSCYFLTLKRRPVGASFSIGVTYVALLELAQVFLFSRYSDTTDLVTGSLGVGLGVWMVHTRTHATYRDLHGPGQSNRRPWVGVAFVTAYVLVLAAIFWAPYDFTADPAVIKPRLKEFFRVPFQVLYTGNDFNAMLQVLRKGLWFAPLGAGLAVTLGACVPTSLPGSRLRTVLVSALTLFLAAVIAVGLELGQLFLPSKIFDLTDILLCWLGALAGLLALRLFAPQFFQSR